MMMQQPMDVSSLLRQNANEHDDAVFASSWDACNHALFPLQSSSMVQRPAVQSTAGPVLPVPLQSQSVVPPPRGAPSDQGGPSYPEDH